MTADEISQAALEYMQSVFAADPAAAHALVCNRVPTNEAMIDHPFAVCESAPIGHDETNAPPMLGMLGVVNGLLASLGVPSDGLVAAKFDYPPGRRPVFVGFKPYSPPIDLTGPNEDLV
jgi:hypothetical protein